MAPLIPKPGDKEYRNRKILYLPNIDYEALDAITATKRDYPGGEEYEYSLQQGNVPYPSAKTVEEMETEEPQEVIEPPSTDLPLTLGQKIFMTRITCDTEDQSNNFAFKVWLGEVIRYLVFVLVMGEVMMTHTRNTNYYMNAMMTGRFIDGTGFMDISSHDGIWEWMEGPLLDSIYNSSSEYNVMVSKPRLRMQRIRPLINCHTHVGFNEDIEECYSHYHWDIEDVEPIDPEEAKEAAAEAAKPPEKAKSRKRRETKKKTTIKEKDVSEIRSPFYYTLLPGSILGFDFWGEALHWGQAYFAGGFLEYLPEESDEGGRAKAAEQIKAIKEGGWTTDATRLILIDIQHFNENLNTIILTRLALEMPPTGGVFPTTQLRTVQDAAGFHDAKTLIFEILFVLMTIYYIAEKVYELNLLEGEYWESGERICWVLVLFLSFLSIWYKLIKYIAMDAEYLITCEPLKTDPGDCYVVNMAFWERQFEVMASTVVCLTWCMCYKFFCDFPSMQVIQTTFARAFDEILAFLVVASVTYFAYAYWGTMLFHGEMDRFKNFFVACWTQFRCILGDFDFGGMYYTNRILGPVYFCSYIGVICWIMLNFFIAIISDTYSEVKGELSNSTRRFPVADKFNEIIEAVWAHVIIADVSESQSGMAAIKNLNHKGGKIDWRAFLEEMLKSGVPDSEIRTYFQQYDTDGSMSLDEKEFHRLKESIGMSVSNLHIEENNEEDMMMLENELMQKVRQDFCENAEFEEQSKRVAVMEELFEMFTLQLEAIEQNMKSLRDYHRGIDADIAEQSKSVLRQVANSIVDIDPNHIEIDIPSKKGLFGKKSEEEKQKEKDKKAQKEEEKKKKKQQKEEEKKQEKIRKEEEKKQEKIRKEAKKAEEKKQKEQEKKEKKEQKEREKQEKAKEKAEKKK